MKNILKRVTRSEKKEENLLGSTFLSQGYQAHNIARLAHLESLGLPISSKSVFEFGAGIGDHSFYFLIKNCQVTASDSRPELVDFIQGRFGLPAIQLDIERDLDMIKALPHYNIFYCYGVLYHVSNPKEFIQSLAGKCDMFLLETCVSHDYREQGPHLVTEDVNNPTQASSGMGCRPTRQWIMDTLKEVFPYVYVPLTQPEHQEFPKDWSEPREDRRSLIRAVFVASTQPLNNPRLSETLVKQYS